MTTTRTDATLAALAVDPHQMTYADRVARVLEMARDLIPYPDTTANRALAAALDQIAEYVADAERESFALAQCDDYLASMIAETRSAAERSRDAAAQCTTGSTAHAHNVHANAVNYGRLTAYRDARRVLDIARGI